MKCTICECEAEFCSPVDLCEYHWNLWWYTGMFSDISPVEDMTEEEEFFYNKVRNGERLEVNKRVVKYTPGLEETKKMADSALKHGDIIAFQEYSRLIRLMEEDLEDQNGREGI